MRTTLDIADDVLLAVKERARRERRSAGEVLSEYAREGLTHRHRTSEATEPESFYGFRPLPARGTAVSNELIDKLREEGRRHLQHDRLSGLLADLERDGPVDPQVMEEVRREWQRLNTAVALKIAAMGAQGLAASDAPEKRLYGYSIQGILFEISDPDYESPEGVISVEVDTHDGQTWVCHLNKKIAPENLQDLWRTEVVITGDATFRARKNILEAKTFKSLPGVADPVKALDELVALCGDLRGEPVQAFMDRVRERD